MKFRDRREAGQMLARHLRAYTGRRDVIVLGIPRGGVPVAFEIAIELKAPLDVFVLRKLGVPGHEELAFGAIASGGARVLDREITEVLGISEPEIERITANERKELMRRELAYRGGRPPLNIKGLTVIVVDDGIATGSSLRAGIKALRQLKPAKIVIGAPVAPLTTFNRLKTEVDDVVCVEVPESFYAIGQFYEDFLQVTDREVVDLLKRSHQSAERKIA
jgi:putative phosphoribosyl transferase